jgi:hypothetical protein
VGCAGGAEAAGRAAGTGGTDAAGRADGTGGTDAAGRADGMGGTDAAGRADGMGRVDGTACEDCDCGACEGGAACEAGDDSGAGGGQAESVLAGRFDGNGGGVLIERGGVVVGREAGRVCERGAAGGIDASSSSAAPRASVASREV